MDVAIIGALIIGLCLGMLGSGGSIMTVPVLVFILQQPEKQAIAESLAIVGLIAMMASLPYAVRSQIHWRSVIFFGLPGMIGASAGGCGAYFVSSKVQMLIFAGLMFAVAGMMLFGPASFERKIPYKQPAWLVMLEGFLMGCFTGCIGIGGGFLIVPALVILMGLTMQEAIGTSLFIVMMNAVAGFSLQLAALEALKIKVDWHVIAFFSFAGILGSFAGGFLGKKMSQLLLRRIFGLSVLTLAISILYILI